MKGSINLKEILIQSQNKEQQLMSFSLICLGVIESLASGTMNVSNAIELFFHADNCLFVKKVLKRKNADRLMSHGTQLHDLFDILPIEQAGQEFQKELAIMHKLCLELIGKEQKAA